MNETTGLIDFRVGKETLQTWYKLVGDLHSGVRPVIALHGGPGISHEYMLPHVELFTTRGIPVIFYDQIGIGKSTHCRDKPDNFWTLDLFEDELDNVLSHFGIAHDFDLLGHSWGGMLAADYAATRHPAGLKHLVLANSPASIELWERGTNNLLQGFPQEFGEMLRKHENEGTTSSVEYKEGLRTFHQKHTCAVDPWPEMLLHSFSAMDDDPTVANAMLGPCEFKTIGSLRTWSVIEKLHTISVPTLLINSPQDTAQDIAVIPFYQRIPKVKWVQLVNSTHIPFFEEKERYFELVADFFVI